MSASRECQHEVSIPKVEMEDEHILAVHFTQNPFSKGFYSNVYLVGCSNSFLGIGIMKASGSATQHQSEP